MIATASFRKARQRNVIALVLHMGTMSGPAKDFLSRLTVAADRTDRHDFAPGAGSATDIDDDIAEVHIEPYSMLAFPRTFIACFVQLWRLVKDTWFFARSFRKLRVGCVISATTYTPAAYLAGRLLGIRTIVFCGELYDKGWISGSGRTLSAHLIRRVVPHLADVIISCSELASLQFSQNHRARVVTLYSPIAVRPVTEPDDKLRAAFGLPHNAVIISLIGTITYGRGHDVAVTALNELRLQHPDAVLAIAGEPWAGDGDDGFLDSIYELVRDLDLNAHVRFLGNVPFIEELINISEVVINPARFNEPFGRVAYEALAMHRPVVVTETGALAELLRDNETALFIPPNDSKALAEAVHRLLVDPSLANSLIANARPVIAALNQEDNDRRFMDILSSMT